MIEVKIRLFGAFRKYGDGSEIRIPLPKNASINSLRSVLGTRLEELYPGFGEAGLLQDSAFANDTEILRNDSTLDRDCVVAVLPPVCGG